MFTLHYSPRTIAAAVAIAMEETGVTYDAVLVDFSKSAQTSPEFLALNPKGRVPVVITSHGILTEAGAIIEYVAPSLVPTDAFAAAKMRELIYYLASTMHPNHAHGVRGIRWADDAASFADMKRKVPVTMAASCAHLEEMLPSMPFAIGTGAVASDPYLYVVLTWLAGDGVDIGNYPILQKFQKSMDARASVLAVRARGIL